MKLFFRRSGFTVLELLITILISFMVLAGFSALFIQINTEIQDSDSVTKTYSSLTDFIQKMNVVSKDYVNSRVYRQSGSGAFDVVLYTNSGSTYGVLVGVAGQTSGVYVVDPASNYFIYGDKPIFIQNLSSSQVSSILTNSGYIWSNLQIRQDSLFPKLIVNQLSVTEYNSSGSTLGSLLEYSLKFYKTRDAGFDGSDIRDIMLKKTVDLIPANLVF